MWQMGSAPFLGGGFEHFYGYSPERLGVRYITNTYMCIYIFSLSQHICIRQYLCTNRCGRCARRLSLAADLKMFTPTPLTKWRCDINAFIYTYICLSYIYAYTYI